MSIPLYHQIANTLAREISQSRSAAPQDAHALLPSELVLCERFQVSRHTIRAALAQLVNEGLVTRKKRSGTRVNAHSGVGAFRENYPATPVGSNFTPAASTAAPRCARFVFRRSGLMRNMLIYSQLLKLRARY
jgi:DNA-binding transcriptional MocR family regulator